MFRFTMDRLWKCWLPLLAQQQLWLQLLLLVAKNPMMKTVIAGEIASKCSVQDRHGKQIDLTQVLPDGVQYFSPVDRLECSKPNSCEGWTIQGCTKVQCSKESSCQNVQFVDNANVLCWSGLACQDARFIRSILITCGGFPNTKSKKPQPPYFCNHAEIGINTTTVENDSATLLCIGAGACVSDSLATPLVVHVGGTGKIKCENLSSGQERACQNMLVWVNHSRRACVQSYDDYAGDCAVRCLNDWDCEFETIQFRVKE